MKLSFKISTLAASMALLAVSAVGQATPVEATYSIALNTSDPGLKLQYEDIASQPFSFGLSPADPSHMFPLFQMWTDESWFNDDDWVSEPISVAFNFTLPRLFNGAVTGTTQGHVWQTGNVQWDGPLDVYFGPKGDGHLSVSLSDGLFGHSGCFFFGCWSGKDVGAVIKGEFTLVHEATALPEPGGLAMFGLSLLAIGGLASRQRKGVR